MPSVRGEVLTSSISLVGMHLGVIWEAVILVIFYNIASTASRAFVCFNIRRKTCVPN